METIYEEIYSAEMEERANSAQKYSLVKYTLEIKRRPLYYVMLLIVPCLLCTLLVLVSFAIPAENGERIGFCSTILTSVSVYLLMMAEILPEKSDTLPILGIYYTVTMIGIALVIVATILVLSAHHAVTEPPACFKALYKLRKPKKKRETKKFLKRNAVASEITTGRSDADAIGQVSVASEVPTIGSDEDMTGHAPAPVDHKPIVGNFVTDNESTEDEKRKIWRSVAVLCDRILFWLFLIMFVVSTGYLVMFRPVFMF